MKPLFYLCLLFSPVALLLALLASILVIFG